MSAAYPVGMFVRERSCGWEGVIECIREPGEDHKGHNRTRIYHIRFPGIRGIYRRGEKEIWPLEDQTTPLGNVPQELRFLSTIPDESLEGEVR